MSRVWAVNAYFLPWEEISLGLLILPEKVTRKYLESPEKDNYTHYDMSVTWYHCNLVRYYHTGSAQKALLTLKETQHNADQGYTYAIGCFCSQWQVSIFDPSHQYLNSLLRSLYLRLYHSSN